MDGTVIFCNDGILRFQSASTETAAIPLELIQAAIGIDPYPFFLQQIRKPFLLEEGSTVGTFLLCLTPWASVVSDLTDRDVQKYITELRKPSADEPAFDRCEVRKCFGFSREMQHDPMPEGMSIIEWFNRPRGETVWLDTYESRCEYDISGYTNGDPSNYSMSTSIHKLKNVPLIINRVPIVVVYDRPDHGAPFLNPDAAGVIRHLRGGDGDDNRVAGQVLIAKGTADEYMTTHDLLSVVIEQGLWFNTPQGAMREREMLDDIIASLPKDEDEPDSPPAEDEVCEESNKMTVSVAPGAFDGIVTHYENEKSEWEELVDKVKQSPSLPFRIGAVTETIPVDDRASGMIFK